REQPGGPDMRAVFSRGGVGIGPEGSAPLHSKDHPRQSDVSPLKKLRHVSFRSRAAECSYLLSGYFFFPARRAGRRPAGFLCAVFGATFGFSLPQISESASAALNGYRRCDNCSGTPGASSLRSTRRLAARTIVLMFPRSLFFSLAVSEGSSSIDCFTSLGAS